MPTLNRATVLVTGANGGIGQHFVREALVRGATKIYAAARAPIEWNDPRIVPLALDITHADSIRRAVSVANDTTVLINNAGTNPETASLLDVSEENFRTNMETNFFGPVMLSRAFVPALTRRAGSVLINVHSIASWYAYGGAYSAAKAAMWSATNSLRLELAPRGVHVTGVHMSYVDTPMAAHASGPKLTPADLVTKVFDGVEAGQFEVVADDLTGHVKASLAGAIEALYPELLT